MLDNGSIKYEISGPFGVLRDARPALVEDAVQAGPERVRSASRPFASRDVGECIRVFRVGDLRQGWYQIMAVEDDAAVLRFLHEADAPPGAVEGQLLRAWEIGITSQEQPAARE